MGRSFWGAPPAAEIKATTKLSAWRIRVIFPANEYTVLNLSSTDDYGRTVSPADSKKDKYVGLFFFLTLGQHAGHDGHYDISKITQYGTHYENFQANNERSPLGSAHFWVNRFGDITIPKIRGSCANKSKC